MIGRTASRVSKDDALEFVDGWTCANDVSARDYQFGDGQWFRGKSLDTFCPVGPRVVPRDELDASDLRIQQRLNGETLQDSRTSLLIFDIPTLVSYISRGDHARARRPDPHRHARGRRRLPRAEDRARRPATSSRSRSRGSACCGTTFAQRERVPRAVRQRAGRAAGCGRIVTQLAHFRCRHVTFRAIGSIASGREVGNPSGAGHVPSDPDRRAGSPASARDTVLPPAAPTERA